MSKEAQEDGPQLHATGGTSAEEPTPVLHRGLLVHLVYLGPAVADIWEAEAGMSLEFRIWGPGWVPLKTLLLPPKKEHDFNLKIFKF